MRMAAFCDGENKLLFRSEGRNVATGAYSFSNECRDALSQFRANGGCFCGPDNALMCLERGFSLAKIGAPFSFGTECRSALKGMNRDVEIKFGVPSR
jgi:hypothetical protein